MIELFHRPGAGGSTLSKSIALQFYEQYPTVLINEYHKSRTSDALFELSTLSQKPILAIVEAHKVSQNNLNRLIRQINEDKKYVVIVYVKRSYTEPKLKPNLIFLSEKMVSISERNRFVSKFLQIAEKKNYNRIKQLENRHPANCDIIDFPLTTFENDYEVDSLDKYIISYLSKLPSSQLKFTCFTSLLYYYTQKNISEFWLTELFPQKSLRNELLQRPSSERYIEKVFLNELDDEFQETEFWRPKYNRFAVETLQLCIMGLDQARKANWKDHLHRWVVEFIKEIRNSNEYLTDDISDILKSLILERDHEDLLGVDESYETRKSNRKISRILKDITVKEH